MQGVYSWHVYGGNRRDGLRNVPRRLSLRGGRKRGAALRRWQLSIDAWRNGAERLHHVSSWLGVCNGQHGSNGLWCWDDHGDHRPERVRCVCSRHVSVGERLDRLHRLSGWQPVFGACDCSDGVQPRLDRCHDRPEQLRGVCCGHVSVAGWSDGLRCVSCGLVLLSGRERGDELRGWQLSQHDGRDGSERLHDVSCGLSLSGWIDCFGAMRTWHHHR